MKIGIISAGQLGSAYAKRWAKAGHQVILTNSGDLSKLNPLLAEIGANASAAPAHEAVAQADVIFLSVLWKKLDAVLEKTGSLDGKIVVDSLNALTAVDMIAGAPKAGENEHFFEALGTGSTSDAILKHSPNAKVVKALNYIGAFLLEQCNSSLTAGQPTGFYCGDDSDAKEIAAHLIQDAGFLAMDAGALKNAYLLETLPKLYHELVEANGDSNFAFTVTHFTKAA